MESKIKYIQNLKAQQADQVHILKSVHDQQQAYHLEIMTSQKVVKAPI